MACSVGGASSAEEERDRFEESRKRMSIPLNALYIIPLIMVLVAIILLFQAEIPKTRLMSHAISVGSVTREWTVRKND